MRTRRRSRETGEDEDRNDSDESEESNDVNSCSNEDDEAYISDDDEDSYQTDDEEEESKLIQTKTLLFLCQEGQIRLARQRLKMLQEENKLEILKKEIFQTGQDQNYPLHEVIMGGTLEESSKNIIPEILEIGQRWKGPLLLMMNAQPPSHGRTALHWATWGNASLEILRALTLANPDALLLRDKKAQGSRTPLEILKRYHVPSRCNVFHQSAMKKVNLLESSTQLWIQHRLRLAVYKATLYWFRHEDMVPFDKKGRKEAGISPKHWFCLSVLGYCLQREMEPLMWRILGFVGGNAKVASRKRRRS